MKSAGSLLLFAGFAFVGFHAFQAFSGPGHGPEQRVLAAGLMVVCALFGLGSLMGGAGVGRRLPDLLSDLRRPAEIFESGAAQMSIQVREDARRLRIDVLVQNLYDAPTDFRLALDAPGTLAAAIPDLYMALPTGGLVAASVKVPLPATAGWSKGHLVPRCVCRAPGGARRVRPKRRHLLAGRAVKKALSFELAPGPEGRTRCPVQWSERVVWSPSAPTDHDTLVTRLRRVG